MHAVEDLADADRLQVLAHPLRVQILDRLREPLSAAGLARQIGAPRQKVNYHLRELERAALVRPVGERRSRNFVERLFQSVAKTFVVSPRVTWGSPLRAKAFASQLSLRTLVTLGEQLQQDAAVLLDRAAFEHEAIASASVVGDVHFDSEADRAAFMKAYLAAVRPLLKRYQVKKGIPYRILAAVYPTPERGGEDEA